MFAIPGQNAIKLTQSAVLQINKLMETSKYFGLRVGVKKGGCAGMEYTMEYVTEPDKNDEIVEQDGARVLIAPMAQMFLLVQKLTMNPHYLNQVLNLIIQMSPRHAAAESQSNSKICKLIFKSYGLKYNK